MTDATSSDFDHRLSACPACDVVPLALKTAEQAIKADDILLSLPGAHCATCITDVERALTRHPGVKTARVNLTLRRVTVDAPGLLAEDLIPIVEAAGYEAHELDPAVLAQTHADRQGRDLLMRLGVAGFAMMNVMILSIAVWSGADAATRDLFHWISGAIALPTVAFAGKPFFANAWRGLKAGRVVMDFPISLALILASGISIYETMHSGQHAYFDGVVSLCFFLLIGRYLDYRARAVARSAAEELTALEVPRAVRLVGEVEETVPLADLRVDDLVLIRPGARMPVDGVVTQGTSDVDRSLLTGESLPVIAGIGSTVSAGEVNLTGPLVVRVSAAGRDSSLSRLADLVAIAEESRSRYTTLAQKASEFYTPTVHLLAFLSLVIWFWLEGDLRIAINVAAAVLIITCPCALGLAVPAVVTTASGRLFRKGLLIKDGTALERLAEVDTVVFDKTGTLTKGEPQILSTAPLPPDLRGVARRLAEASMHPLSRALAKALSDEGAEPSEVSGIREIPGSGVTGVWNGGTVRLGRARWVGASAGKDNHTSTWLQVDGRGTFRLDFEDQLRPGAADCVQALKAMGMRIVLLSGDNPAVVEDTARRLGIDDWRAEQTPEDKRGFVADCRSLGAKVLMVGDGLNDTAALAEAHVAISPASALDAARVASDVVLLGSDLLPVADSLEVATRAKRRIKENFAISFGYNIVAVPFALLGFATPLLAALAMSISSISVTANALRLR